jgi:ribonuclease G
MNGMQAAFVTIAKDCSGFLSARDAQPRRKAEVRESSDALLPIGKCVQEGEAILVQVTKEPLGKKGPRLSRNVTLPGRYIVLTPFQDLTALSRCIKDEAERDALFNTCKTIRRHIKESFDLDCGMIVRTAGATVSAGALQSDAETVARDWFAILNDVPNRKPPARLRESDDPVIRVLRDLANQKTNKIVIDDEAAYAKARSYAERIAPELFGLLECHRSNDLLFDVWRIEEQIEAALARCVPLSTGGWITIEPTEALTAVDVNSGTFDHQGGLEQTALHTNLEAAKEVARQLRLRGLGGLIVIDFIHMDEMRHRDEVVSILSRGLRADSAAFQMGEISEFGTLQLTRTRVRQSLIGQLTEPSSAPRRQPTYMAAAGRLFRELKRAAGSNPGQDLRAHISQDLADWLVGDGTDSLSQLRARLGVEIAIDPDQARPRGRYEISVGDTD